MGFRRYVAGAVLDVKPVFAQNARVILDHFAAHENVRRAQGEVEDREQATGEAAKETMAINKSLSTLSRVFVSKATGAAHVPFKDSKLTHLMEPCLSGQGKTLMVVNVGPEADNAQETLCSLRFGEKLASVRTSAATSPRIASHASRRRIARAASPMTPSFAGSASSSEMVEVKRARSTSRSSQTTAAPTRSKTRALCSCCWSLWWG